MTTKQPLQSGPLLRKYFLVLFLFFSNRQTMRSFTVTLLNSVYNLRLYYGNISFVDTSFPTEALQ